MAVSLKTNTFYDTRTRREIEVHSIKVTKSNKKGVTELVDGKLVEHKNGDDWHIEFESTVNGRPKKWSLVPGIFVFRTGTSKRWQVLWTKQFNDRFKIA